MDKRLQEMLDYYEITRLLSEYCHAVDRMDEVRMAGVYARVSWDDHGPIKCPGPEFAERITRQMQSGTSIVGSHMLGQTLVKVIGDEAGADTYFIATSRKLAEDGREILNQMGGRYVDCLVREDGRWKIKTRICVYDWSASISTDDWLYRAKFVQGKRSAEDPSFAVLESERSRVSG
jgi:SnoaL-like domain